MAELVTRAYSVLVEGRGRARLPGLAGGSPVWGRLADRSSRLVMATVSAPAWP